MVKFGKKFFFNATYSKKNRTVTIIAILTVILLIVTTFFITSQFYDNSNPKNQKIEVYEEINIKLFDKLPYMLTYFKHLENVKITDIKLKYPDNFSYTEDTVGCTEEEITLINSIKNGENTEANIDEAFSCVSYKSNIAGSFNVKITIGKTEYNSTLKVIDDLPPVLNAKDFEIYEDEYYNIDDFVVSCEDNSKQNCDVDYLNTNLVDYSKYKEPGIYPIKIQAKDASGNKSEALTVNLTIKEIKYYTVTFNTAGGSSVESQQVREGRNVSYPTTPSRNGYYFKGWYYNNKEFDLSTPVNSDMTITAKWEKAYTPPTGGSSGGGISPGGNSGGGSSNTCIKYDEFYGNISIYNYQLNGGTKNDCLTTTSYKDLAETIAQKYQQASIDEYRDIYAYESYCHVNSYYNVNGVNFKGKRAGYYITYTVTSDCAPSRTYELECKSKDNCELW